MIWTVGPIVFFILVYIVYSTIISKRDIKKYGIPTKIRNSYKKITVPLNKINILTRDYYEDEEINDRWGSRSTDDLFNININIKQIQKFISIITYDDFLYNGKKYSFKSIPIDKSDTEIKELFQNEESISIYFDENDLTKYFFDLSILANT
jgi:hypothetical protein